jgi:hypothetical protein
MIEARAQCSTQCCGSGSGIRCFFTPRIRDKTARIRNTGSTSAKYNTVTCKIEWKRRWESSQAALVPTAQTGYDVTHAHQLIATPVAESGGIKSCCQDGGCMIVWDNFNRRFLNSSESTIVLIVLHKYGTLTVRHLFVNFGLNKLENIASQSENKQCSSGTGTKAFVKFLPN